MKNLSLRILLHNLNFLNVFHWRLLIKNSSCFHRFDYLSKEIKFVNKDTGKIV